MNDFRSGVESNYSGMAPPSTTHFVRKKTRFPGRGHSLGALALAGLALIEMRVRGEPEVV